MNSTTDFDHSQLTPEMLKMFKESYSHLLTPKLGVVDAEGGVLIQPEPGYVLKGFEVNASNAQNKEKGLKVFINICGHDDIDTVHERSIAEDASNSYTSSGQPGIRIPLSIGSKVEDVDKKNEPCTTIDIVINKSLMIESLSDLSLKNTIAEFILVALQQKYQLHIEGLAFPKMKYKGTLPPAIQRIRKQSLSKITELPSNKTTAPTIGAPPTIPQKNSTPNDVVPHKAFLDGNLVVEAFLYSPEEAKSDEMIPVMTDAQDLFSYKFYLPTHKKKFDYGKALRVDKREKEVELEETRKFLQLYGMRIIVRLNLLSHFIPMDASKLFTVAISNEGLKVSCNRLGALYLTDKSASVPSPPYNPFHIWFPCTLDDAASKCRVWWDASERSLTIDCPFHL